MFFRSSVKGGSKMSVLTSLPIATFSQILSNVGKSMSTWEGLVSDLAMGVLFLVGIFCIFQAFSKARKSQPWGMLAVVGVAAMLVSGVFFNKFKESQEAVNKVAGGSAQSALDGKG